MAIALDNTASGTASAASKTISFTAAANTLIIVGAGNNLNQTGANVTCTWNGAAMTKDAEIAGTAGTGRPAAIFSIYETTGGTHDIVYTSTGDNFVTVGVASFTGAKNAHAWTHSAGSTADTAVTSLSDTIDTTGHNNALHIVQGDNGDGGAITAGSGSQVVVIDSGDAHSCMWASSPYSVTPAGSNTVSITFTTANHYVEIGASYDVAPAAASGGANAPMLGLLGVGL